MSINNDTLFQIFTISNPTTILYYITVHPRTSLHLNLIKPSVLDYHLIVNQKFTGESFRLIPKDYKVLRYFLPIASFIGGKNERDIIQYKSKSTGDRDYEREKDNDLYLSCDDSFDTLSLFSNQIISFYSINAQT